MMAIWITPEGKIIDDGTYIDFVEIVWGDVLRRLSKEDKVRK